MKYLRTSAIFSLLVTALFLNWNCSDENNIGSLLQQNDDKESYISDATYSITVKLKISQIYSSSDCPAIEYVLLDTTQTFTGSDPTPGPSASFRTLGCELRDEYCSAFITSGWKVERYVEWTDCGPNRYAYWGTPSAYYIYHSLTPISGGPYSWSQTNVYTNWSCYKTYAAYWGVTGITEDNTD